MQVLNISPAVSEILAFSSFHADYKNSSKNKKT